MSSKREKRKQVKRQEIKPFMYKYPKPGPAPTHTHNPSYQTKHPQHKTESSASSAFRTCITVSLRKRHDIRGPFLTNPMDESRAVQKDAVMSVTPDSVSGCGDPLIAGRKFRFLHPWSLGWVWGLAIISGIRGSGSRSLAMAAVLPSGSF